MGIHIGFINRNQIQLVAAEVEGATADNNTVTVCAQLPLNLADDAGIFIQQTPNFRDSSLRHNIKAPSSAGRQRADHAKRSSAHSRNAAIKKLPPFLVPLVGGSVDVVVLVAVDCRNSRLLASRPGHVVEHLPHDASVVQHGSCTHPPFGADNTAISMSSAFRSNLGPGFAQARWAGAVGTDGLAEATPVRSSEVERDSFDTDGTQAQTPWIS